MTLSAEPRQISGRQTDQDHAQGCPTVRTRPPPAQLHRWTSLGTTCGHPAPACGQACAQPVYNSWGRCGTCLPDQGLRHPHLWRKKNKLHVSKPSPWGVAVPRYARHAFQVDQREWDYGARMPRDRRAADPLTTQSPESPDYLE